MRLMFIFTLMVRPAAPFIARSAAMCSRVPVNVATFDQCLDKAAAMIGQPKDSSSVMKVAGSLLETEAKVQVAEALLNEANAKIEVTKADAKIEVTKANAKIEVMKAEEKAKDLEKQLGDTILDMLVLQGHNTHRSIIGTTLAQQCLIFPIA